MKSSYIKLYSISLLCFIGLLVFSNTFFNAFHYDDKFSIVDNFSIRNIGNFQHIWNFWPTRFVTYFTIALNYHLGGLRVLDYHVVSFCLHFGCAILVWWLTCLTLDLAVEDHESSKVFTLAFFTSALFLLHPLQTQPVNYIIQRATLLAAFFYLATLGLYVKARTLQERSGCSRQWKMYYCVSLVTALVSVFSKEMAISLPLSICLYEIFFLKFKRSFKFLFPFLAIALVVPLTMAVTRSVDFHAMHRVGESVPGMSIGSYLLTQLKVYVMYLRLLFLPFNQNLDYDIPLSRSLFEIPVILSLITLFSVLFVGILLRNRCKTASFGIFWFFITLLPESSVIPINDVMVEHRLYLPMFGFSLFIATGLYSLFKQRNIKVFYVLIVALIFSYALLTHQRNKVWKDELTLWDDVVHKSPVKGGPYNARGAAYLGKKSYDKALIDFNEAIKLNPSFPHPYFNRAQMYQQQDQLDQALLDYEHGLTLDPKDALAHCNRGLILYTKRQMDEAVSSYNKAIKINPTLALAYNLRGLVYDRRGDRDQAIADFDRALEIDPGYYDAYSNRGLTQFHKGNFDQAILNYNKAIQLNSTVAVIFDNRGLAYQSKKDFDHAFADFNRAIDIDPRSANLFVHRAQANYMKQDYVRSWQDVAKAKTLGAVIPKEFMEALELVSGRVDQSLSL